MPKFVVTKTKDQQKELHPYLNAPQRIQQEAQTNSLANASNEEKSSTPLKILKRFFGWFTQDNNKSNSTEQFLTINYPIDEELDRIVLPPLDLPLNPNAPNLVVAQPRLPPSQRPCIAYSEEDYSCFPYHEFDPKHPILGEHYESAHEVTLFFKNLSPYEYEVAKAVKDNLLKKCIWTPSYLVYENRRIMYSARLLAITTHLNYESFEFYKYTYDYTTNTATIIAPVFKSNPSKYDETSCIQQVLTPIDFATKSHTLVGKPVKSDYIYSDPYEDKWLADLEKYFSDKKAAAEKEAKLSAEAKAASEKKEALISVSKNNFIAPLPKPNPKSGVSSSIFPTNTDESLAKKRPLTLTQEPPLKAPSVSTQNPFSQQSASSTFSQSSSSKNKRQLSDTEDEEPSSSLTKKHNITDSKVSTDDSEESKHLKTSSLVIAESTDSGKPSADKTVSEFPSKQTTSFFGFGSTSQPIVSSTKPVTTPTFSFDFGKGSSVTVKKSSPYQSSSTLFSKPELKTVSDNDDAKENHLEKTELNNIPSVPFGGSISLPKLTFSTEPKADTSVFGKFNTLNTSSKPETAKISENNESETPDIIIPTSKPLEEKTSNNPFTGFSFGQKSEHLPDKEKSTSTPFAGFSFGQKSEPLSDKSKDIKTQDSEIDSSSNDAKPEESKTITPPNPQTTDAESSEKDNVKLTSLFGSISDSKNATIILDSGFDQSKKDSAPKTADVPTFSFSTSPVKTSISDSTALSAPQATPTSLAQTTTALVPLNPVESNIQMPSTIGIDSKSSEKLPAASPGSPMSITPLQATPEKNDSMQISPPRAPNSPVNTFKGLSNPFQVSATSAPSNPFGASTTSNSQTFQFSKPSNPFANANPQPTSTPLSTGRFSTNRFNTRTRPNVQPLGSTNPSVDIFASGPNKFATSLNNANGSGPNSPGLGSSISNSGFGANNASNPFGNTNSFGANNANNTSNLFGTANNSFGGNNNTLNTSGSNNNFGSTGFAANTVSNQFGSTNSFGSSNNNSISNSFGSNSNFGSIGFGSNTNNNASNPFDSTNNFGSTGFGNNANTNSFGSGNNFGQTSFGSNANNNVSNPFNSANSFGTNNNNTPNSFGTTNSFGQIGFGANANNNPFGSSNNFGSAGLQRGDGHFEENNTPNALPNHLNMNYNPSFSSRTNSVNSGGFSSGPNSVTSRDGSPSNTASHMAGRVIAQPKSRKRN